MKEELTLPRVGSSMEEGTIVAWKVKVGEAFTTGQPIYDLETDKVTMEMEAQVNGTLLEIVVAEGDNAEVGQTIAVIDRKHSDV